MSGGADERRAGGGGRVSAASSALSCAVRGERAEPGQLAVADAAAASAQIAGILLFMHGWLYVQEVRVAGRSYQATVHDLVALKAPVVHQVFELVLAAAVIDTAPTGRACGVQ